MSSQYPTDLDKEFGAPNEDSHKIISRSYDSILETDYGFGSLDTSKTQLTLPSNILQTTNQSVKPTGFLQDTRRRNEMLRERVLVMRSGLRAERAELRRQEAAKADADDKLIRFVNREASNLMGNSKSLQQLEQLQWQCQRVRDSYGPREYEYRQHEEELEDLEDKLNRNEDRLYNYLSTMPTNDALWKGGRTPSDASSRSSDSTEYPALLNEFLSKIGDLSILRERYDALQTDKEKLEDQKEIRKFANLLLSPEDQKFLDNFQATSDDLLRDIMRLQRTCDDLEKECLDEGLLGVDSSPSSSSAASVVSRRNSILSHETQDTEDKQEMSFELKTDEIGTSFSPPTTLKLHTQLSQSQVALLKVIKAEDRINLWLLETLNSSTIEVLVLATYLCTFTQGGARDLLKGAQKYWFKDDTAQMTKANQNQAKSDWSASVSLLHGPISTAIGHFEVGSEDFDQRSWRPPDLATIDSKGVDSKGGSAPTIKTIFDHRPSPPTRGHFQSRNSI